MSFPLIETYLRESIGLDSSSLGPALLPRVVRRRMELAEINDERSYLNTLHADAGLRQQLIEDLVVPETWFFRDREPFTLLARLAMNRRAAGQRVRVLSLPCATGEEAYTIAISLLEAGLAPGDFSIDAMDISEAALAVARHAVYGRNSFRDGERTPPPAWFEAVGERWTPVTRVRDCVKFRRGNLFEFKGHETYDFVFCRNLLIYFDAEMQAEAVKRLLGVMTADGVFFVGHAEAAVVLRAGLGALLEPRCFAFVRRPVVPPMPVRQPLTAAKRFPMRKAAPAATSPKPFSDVVRPEHVNASVSAIGKTALNADSLLHEAGVLANQGRLVEAEALVKRHLNEHGPSALAYYLIAVTHDAVGRTSEAEAAYRKVLYLDPNHTEALTHLALLLEKRGSPEAERLWRRGRRPHTTGGAGGNT